MEAVFSHPCLLNISQLAIVNDRFVAVGDNAGDVYIVDTCTKRFTQKARVHSNAIVHLCFSPNGKTFVSADENNLCVMETKSGRLLHLLPYEQNVKPVWLNDQTITYGGKTYLTAFNIQTQEETIYFDPSRCDTVIGVSSTQHAIFSSFFVHIYDSTTHERTKTVRHDEYQCEYIDFLDEKQLVIIFRNHLSVVNIASGEFVRKFPFELRVPQGTFRVPYNFDISFDKSCLLINDIVIPYLIEEATVRNILIFDIISGKLISSDDFNIGREDHTTVKFSRKGDKIFGIYGHCLQYIPTPPTALSEMEEKTKELQRSSLVL